MAEIFLSIGLTALMLGVSSKTLRRWDKAGTFAPCFRTIGNHRRYSRSKVLEFSKIKKRAKNSIKGGAIKLNVRFTAECPRRGRKNRES